MIPVGYMAKKISEKPDWITATNTQDIYSVSGHVSHAFAEYIKFWKHNCYWFFDTPDIIAQTARDNGIDISQTKVFYYEVYDKQYNTSEKSWTNFTPESSFLTNVQPPEKKKLEGYDVVSFSVQTSPECSPLSCNNLAQSIPVNIHCLLQSFEKAKLELESGQFDSSEPGPFRIFAVYSLPEVSIRSA